MGKDRGISKSTVLYSEPTDFFVYECSLHIAAPADKVFRLVGNLGESAGWAGSGHIRSITQTTDGPVGVGTRFRSEEKIIMRYRADTEIIEYRPPEAIAWRSKPVGERVPYHRWAFQLIPENGGTRLIHEVRAARAAGVLGWIQWLGFAFTRPRKNLPPGMERTLATVKALAEHQA